MPISIPAFLSYLLLIGPARAQVSAPNCTNSTFAWVGFLRSDARFVSITTRFFHCAGVFIVVQFAPTKSLLDLGVPGGDVSQRLSLDPPLAHHIRSYQRAQCSLSLLCRKDVHTLDQLILKKAIYANATRSYTTSSAHVMRARESRGFRALINYVFAWIPTNRPTCLISYSTWSFNCTTKATPGT